MAAAKCSQCGFVGARGNEVCKRCGTSLYQDHASQVTAGNKRPKIIALGIASVILVLLAGAWFASSVFPTATPSPAEVAGLLYADSSLSPPLTIRLPTELQQKFKKDDVPEWFLLEDYFEAQVLKQLGLTTVDVNKVKEDKPDCWRYRMDRRIDAEDIDASTKPSDLFGDPLKYPDRIPDPNGPFEQCDDVWTYNTKLEFDDPETIDVAALSENVKSLADLPDPLSVKQQSLSLVRGVVNSTAVPIGTVKIVEVSDVVLNKAGVYSVGFKFRLKPNGLGELFDINGAIHKSLPQGIRQTFRNDIVDRAQADKRVLYMVSAMDSEGLTRGHAELKKAGLFSRKWTIGKVYLDQMDDTRYTFHRVE
jgi:hypothetical protein